MKVQKLEKREKIYISIAVVVFVLLFIVLLVASLTRKNGNTTQPSATASVNDGYSDVEESRYSVSINNYYQLKQTYGYNGALAIRKQLETIIFSESELAAATKEAESPDGTKTTYSTTLVESSFRLHERSPNVYAFTLEVSDGRTYDVYVRPCFDDAVEICFGVVAIRDGIVMFDSKAVSADAIEALEDWKNQF